MRNMSANASTNARYPQISVVTVCFNGAATIAQTIRSVAAQEGVSLQYIVIDGGSQDGTVDVLREHTSVIDDWISEPDTGIYDAMNKGLARAGGEWVLFLNADDFLASPTSLRGATAGAGDALIVAGRTLIRSGDVDVLFRPSRLFGLNLQLPFMHPSTLVRRSAFECYGAFDTRYRIAADCDFFLRLMRAGHVPALRDEVVTVMRDGGLSNRQFVAGRREYRDAYIRNFGSPLAAWTGYLASLLLRLKARLQ